MPGEVFAKMYDVDDVLNTKFKLISNKQKGMSRDKFFDELFELLKIQIESINEIIDEESLNLA
ncbi:hypothetical protein CP520_00070 [Mesoplasma lactucae ATCC 49193]|uniref:Uncharacterized protein n=1 Tax=Mesoplasma lactucae ATCC 49193 TaxID=81460 RepID=A0A291IQP2_9MOLU|nr:hypothetical protein CP520_00070 [Mesoplasma lactucae ATCC 49193]